MKLNRLLLAVALILLAASAFGQTTGTLTGTVTVDKAPLPGATVTISSPNLQGTRTAVSDVNGNYNFGALPPGDYTVRFEMESMQTVTRTVRVAVASAARADAELRLTTVAEAITVTASAPAILETSEVQTSLTAKLIEDLPVARTLPGAVTLAPGVSAGAGGPAISGGFSFDNTYYMDGAVINEVLRGQPQTLYIEDAIQETTVQSGAISAEFGRFTGGVITAISKSGGNEFSGSFRDSLTDPTWTSQGILKEARPTSQLQSQYEATLGGRIIRDRLWFFAAGRLFNTDQQRFFGRLPSEAQAVPYNATDKERRLEGKLTGQITPRHTVIGSYFDVNHKQTNNSFQTSLEPATLDVSRELPNSFYSINYNGIITNNFLVEALYARQDFSFVGSGADAPATPERGTNIRYPVIGAWAGYPTFCGSCSFPEERNNYNAKLKGSWFLGTKGLGTHNMTFGYEQFQDMLKSDNHQSASDFTLYSYDTPTRGADGTIRHSLSTGNGYIIWWPILESAQGNFFKTDSVFVNDKWELSSKLNFNLGVRYDKNVGKDNAGREAANDKGFSPRVGVNYDLFGNGRLRLAATYGDYASKIANGNVGDVASSAGQPSYLYWWYQGPDLANLPLNQFLDQVYSWFRSVGFTANRDRENGIYGGGGLAGVQTQINGTLKTPKASEWTLGLGSQILTNSFFRVDYVNRNWKNFYTQRVDQATGHVLDPLAEIDVDLNLVENTNDLKREYRAFITQFQSRLFNRVNLGGNYTYSKLRGNAEGETGGSGPVVNSGTRYYPEVLGYAQRLPIGYLSSDQRHRARVWGSYDLSTPIGGFTFGLLERYDSGAPYSASALIIPVQNSRCPQCPAVPSYYLSIGPSTTSTYFFSQRGSFRTDTVTATDVSVNYNLPLGRANLFVQGELLNALNEQAVTSVNTEVRTSRNSNCVQSIGPNAGKRCAGFNPLTETPVEGINWVKGPSFGKALNPTTAQSTGSFQLPRTYRVSVGVRF